jgi:ABC-2 type transport system permease protein
VLTPLTYLGGVFYSIELLDPFWSNLSMINPVLYMVNAFRYGIIGITDIPIVWAFLIVGLFSTLLFFLALRLLEKGSRLRS